MRLLAVALALAATSAPLAVADHIRDLDDEVPWGCARRDCIPSIEEPRFDDGGWLEPGDRVLGVEIAGDARAYPVRILNWHEIVNDVVGGTPVVVTYCPLCGTGLTFDRTVAGEPTTFGVSGRLYKNDLVMYDRGTESFWSQELGESIWGERHGTRLRFVPTATTTWSEWRAAHPETRVLARPDTYPTWRYAQYPYGNYESDEDTLFPVANPSNALHAKEWVLGVFTDNESVAFRQADVESEGTILDRLDGRLLVVSVVDGSPRARWAEGGEPPRQVLGFWFAWHDFHPTTRLWGKLLAQVVRDPGAPGLAQLIFSEAVDRQKIEAHIPSGVEARWIDERVLELAGNVTFTLPAGSYGVNGTSLSAPLQVDLAPRAQDVAIPALGSLAAILVLGVGGILWTVRRRN